MKTCLPEAFIDSVRQYVLLANVNGVFGSVHWCVLPGVDRETSPCVFSSLWQLALCLRHCDVCVCVCGVVVVGHHATQNHILRGGVEISLVLN